MAHQIKIKDAMVKIKLAQATLANLYEELSQMIPSERRIKAKEKSAKTRLNLQSKIID